MTEDTNNIICPSCNSVIRGRFCSICGEKKITQKDFALKHFIEESIEGITHFDNKFFRSIKLLFTRPGLLSQHHSLGRRVPYMKPFQLFIISNILLFFILGKQNPFSISFGAYQYYKPYILFDTREIIAKKTGEGESFMHYASLFNERMATESKVFIVFFIPVFALLVRLLFFKKKKYFSEHFVFSTHLFSFSVFYFVASYLLIQWPFYYFSGKSFDSDFDLIMISINLFVLAIYFAIASYTFYKIKKSYAALSGLLASFVFFIALFAYRMLLFYKIFYSLD